jgi:hypothetical protein
LAAINHKPLDRIPTDFWGTNEMIDKLTQYLDCENKVEIYDRLGIDGILFASPPYIGPPLPREYDLDFWYKNQI